MKEKEWYTLEEVINLFDLDAEEIFQSLEEDNEDDMEVEFIALTVMDGKE